jgi:hypothetical protein
LERGGVSGTASELLLLLLLVRGDMAGFGGAGLLAELTAAARGDTDDVDADDAPGAAVVRRLMRERGTGVSLRELTTAQRKKSKAQRETTFFFFFFAGLTLRDCRIWIRSARNEKVIVGILLNDGMQHIHVAIAHAERELARIRRRPHQERHWPRRTQQRLGSVTCRVGHVPRH